MCDGAPASVKAIGWASVPGHLMPQHDGAQLILLHAWDKDTALRTAASRENNAKTSIVVDEQTALHCLSPAVVVQKSLEAIMESKVTRDTLNYKLETMVLDLPTVAGKTPSISAVAQQHNSSPSKSSSHAKKEADISSPPPPAAPTTEAEMEANSVNGAEEATQSRANAVAEYALERLNHHQAEALVLGSGNSTAGKSILVGHVSKAILSTVRQTHPLWFIKTGGCTMRINTAMLRYVVVLVPRPGDEESLAKDSLVVQYALERRRKKSSDTVSVVVVAEYNTPPEEVERYSQVIETLLKEFESTIESETCGQENEETDPATPPLPQSIVAENNTVADLPKKESVITLEGEVPPTADGREDAAEGQEQQQWPGISVCQLKPTKQVSEPTVINVSGQVVKFLQRYKTDIVVSPSTLPEELHLALLAMSKQHTLVVPSAEVKSHSSILRTVLAAAATTTTTTAAAEATEKNAEAPAVVVECTE
ncbi:uncharacterized protein TM35_000162150 [Trypanosoma theileri]|uniref:Uncharacterized protein n=1 Tax=Trypanosoma theileri TaxID=67003 RepID=A0A1X0NV55_9TRYP|nr:uncharacterized protein TM35_000162150 [Trypanosoma theileri]ORC88577.1 hypothetical protein TM35_000162150 [Trypanosoma theileri]